MATKKVWLRSASFSDCQRRDFLHFVFRLHNVLASAKLVLSLYNAVLSPLSREYFRNQLFAKPFQLINHVRHLG